MLERLMLTDYKDRTLLITPDQVQEMMSKFQEVRFTNDFASYLQFQKKALNLKFINIVDPTFTKNNLGKSISKMNATRLKHALSL